MNKPRVPQFKRYTPAQRRNAVKRVLAGEPFAAVALATQCTFKTLAYWMAQAGHGPCPWCALPIQDRPALLARIAKLEAQLKKAGAQ